MSRDDCSCPPPAGSSPGTSFAQVDSSGTADAGQTGASSNFDGDFAVGATMPDPVETAELPADNNHGCIMLDDQRVLVDRATHRVVRAS